MDSLTHAQTEAKAEAAAATGQTPTRTLLIALDQSEDDMTAKVIQFTLDHIVKAGDHVILFTSLAYQPATESMLMSVYPLAEDYRLYQELRELRTKGLAALKTRFPSTVTVDLEVDNIEPREAISDAIKRHAPILCVLGRRHLSNLAKLFSSTSVSKHLLLHAETPLLVVK